MNRSSSIASLRRYDPRRGGAGSAWRTINAPNALLESIDGALTMEESEMGDKNAGKTATGPGPQIDLGDRVKDAVSGFEGVVVARTQWLNGCWRITIQPEKLIDGKMVDAQTIDEPQLRLLKKGVVQSPNARLAADEERHLKAVGSGGPIPAPKQKAGPIR